jgi:excinuclease UvrABC ATPase subunit
MCPHCHGLGKIARIDTNLFLDREKTIREGASCIRSTGLALTFGTS